MHGGFANDITLPVAVWTTSMLRSAASDLESQVYEKGVQVVAFKYAETPSECLMVEENMPSIMGRMADGAKKIELIFSYLYLWGFIAVAL